MSEPGWVSPAFAVVMVAAALYHCGRLVAAPVRGHRPEYAVELTQLAMALAMAIMFVRPLGAPASERLALGFALPTLWFVGQSLRAYVQFRTVGHPVALVVTCGAMVYLLSGSASHSAPPPGVLASRSHGTALHGLAQTRSGGGHLTTHPLGLAVLLLVALAGVTVWTMRHLWRAVAARLAGTARPAGTGRRPLVPVSSGLAGSHLAMSVTTIYMLTELLWPVPS